MNLMKKVKFLKEKRGVCACLDNSLFDNESKKIRIIIKTLEFFSNKIERFEGFVFVSINDKLIVDDLYRINCSFELICVTKDLLKRDKEEKYKVIFNKEQIAPVVNFILKNDLTFDGYGYNTNNEFLLSFVINDHDGSYITFNDKIFEKEAYQQLIRNAL